MRPSTMATGSPIFFIFLLLTCCCLVSSLQLERIISSHNLEIHVDPTITRRVAAGMIALLSCSSHPLPPAIACNLPVNNNPTATAVIYDKSPRDEEIFQLFERTSTRGIFGTSLFGFMSEEERQAKLAEYDAKFQQDYEERNQYYAEKWLEQQTKQQNGEMDSVKKKKASIRDIFVSQEEQELQARRRRLAESPQQEPDVQKKETEPPKAFQQESIPPTASIPRTTLDISRGSESQVAELGSQI